MEWQGEVDKVGHCADAEQGVEIAHGTCHRGERAVRRSSSAEGRGAGEDSAGGERHRLPQGFH